MSIFSELFLNFDLFKTPFSLRFNQRKEVSTYLGSFFSLCVICILIYYAAECDLFYRLTPQVIDSSMGLEHRPFVNFTRVKAIGVQDDLTLIGVVDPSIFNLVAISYHYDLKNTSNLKEEYKKIHLCSELDFPENPNLFSELNLANNFCFEENNFDLEGYWDEKIMNYGTVHLMLCNNETYNNKCKSYDEMVKYLNGKTFNLYYYDSIIDNSNYESPVKNVMVNEWTFIDISTRKQREYFFQNIELVTNDGILFNNYIYHHSQQYVNMKMDNYYTLNTDFKTPRATFSFISEKKTRNINRIYEKISFLLAKLGGLFNTFLFIGLIWANFEHNFFIHKLILNTLYTFKIKSIKLESDEEKNKKNSLNFLKINDNTTKNNQIMKCEEMIRINTDPITERNTERNTNQKIERINEIISKSKINQKENFENNYVPQPESEKKIDYNLNTDKNIKIIQISKTDSNRSINISKNKKSFIPSRFSLNKKSQYVVKFQDYKKKQMKDNKINMNVFSFLKMKTKNAFKMKLNNEEEIFNQSRNIVDKNLDCLEILKKLQDIEKLKQILLDNNQMKLFEFISKPLINLNKGDNTIKNNEYEKGLVINLEKKEEDERNELKKLLKYYENKNNDGELTELDKKLLSNLDHDVEEFIEELEESGGSGKINLDSKRSI